MGVVKLERHINIKVFQNTMVAKPRFQGKPVIELPNNRVLKTSFLTGDV